MKGDYEVNLNAIMDDNTLSNDIKSVYKFITDNKKSINKVFDLLYNDMQVLFPGNRVTKNENSIVIGFNKQLSLEDLDNASGIIENSIYIQCNKTIPCEDPIIYRFIFRIYIDNDTIVIKRNH